MLYIFSFKISISVVGSVADFNFFVRCCIASSPKEESNQKRSVNIYTNVGDEFHITMRSSTVSTEGLENVLRSWTEEYQLAISPSKYLRFYVLKSNFLPKSNYNTEDNMDERYLEYLIPPYVTFSKLYFRGKEEIVNRLEFFMSRKQWYKHKRITHNIGFLLHGHPSSGCEKTSTIKGNQAYNL